jgi:hypothetical protein
MFFCVKWRGKTEQWIRKKLVEQPAIHSAISVGLGKYRVRKLHFSMPKPSAVSSDSSPSQTA